MIKTETNERLFVNLFCTWFILLEIQDFSILDRVFRKTQEDFELAKIFNDDLIVKRAVFDRRSSDTVKSSIFEK